MAQPRSIYKKYAESRNYKRDTIMGTIAREHGKVMCIYKMKKSTHRLRKVLRWNKYLNISTPFYYLGYAEYWEGKFMHGHPYYNYQCNGVTYREPANKAQFHFKAAADKELLADAIYIAGPGQLHEAWKIYYRMLSNATRP